MKMSISNIDREFKDLQKKLDKAAESQFDNDVRQLTLDLAAVTPIDTGHARSSWKAVSVNGKAIISNDAEYIQALNEGHSKQAPAHFVEAVAMTYGRPIGVIVSNSKTPG